MRGSGGKRTESAFQVAAVGAFVGDDVLDDGRPVRVRFTWSEITGHSARCDQAFLVEGGATWEDNWTMRFERTVWKTLV